MSSANKISLIGFSGPMGCGKSTAIEELKAMCPNRHIVLVKFAGTLYEIQDFIYDRIAAVHPRPTGFVKDRRLLQILGTEWGRDCISESLWVRLWRANVERALEFHPVGKPTLVVCDDVRFDNEAEVLTQLGGVIVQIRTSRNHERINTKAGIANHQSEAGIADRFVGVRVDNDDSVQQYRNKLKEVFEGLGLIKEEE